MIAGDTELRMGDTRVMQGKQFAIPQFSVTAADYLLRDGSTDKLAKSQWPATQAC